MDEQANCTFQEKIEKIKKQCDFDFIKLAFLQKPNGNEKAAPIYVSGNISMRYLRIVIQTRIGLAGQVAKTGRPAFIIDAEKEIKPEEVQQYPIIMAENLNSLCALPLFQHGEVIGVVLAGFRSSNRMTADVIEKFKKEVKHKFRLLDKAGVGKK